MVADNGLGISPADQPYIFNRFYRADKSRSRKDPGAGSGAGLGLAIAQWIACLHQETVRLEKSDVRGTVFSAWLPSIPHNAAEFVWGVAVLDSAKWVG